MEHTQKTQTSYDEKYADICELLDLGEFDEAAKAIAELDKPE